MQKFLLLLTFLLATATVVSAQKSKKDKRESEIEYGKIPQEDLKMTVYPLDSSADAVVLASKGRLSIEYDNSSTYPKVNYYFFRRVKLLKKSAFDSEGNIAVRYHSIDDYERLESIKAAIIQPDGTRQEFTEKDFFEEKISVENTAKKLAIPNLKEGSIIEYEFEMVSENIATLYDWHFQENIPVRHSELWYTTPEFLEYVYLLRGEQKIKTSRYEKNILHRGRQFTLEIQKMYADSLPALKPEAYMTTLSDYLIQINFQLKRLNGKDFLSTWQKVANDLIKNEDVGQQFGKKSNYNEVWNTIKPLLSGARTDEAKIKVIYDYLCKNISWVDEHYSFYANGTLNGSFKKKKARSGELNMMLLACLSEAGVKALPMLVSTREHGKPVTAYPLLDQFNHLICYIERGEKSLFIDVGNGHRPIGMPRISSLNGQGWLLDKDNPRWVIITPPLSSEATLANFKLTEAGTLRGSISSNYRGYSGVRERDDEAGVKGDKAKKLLAKDYPDIQIDSITIANLDNTEEPFKRIVYCVLPNAATTAGDLIYIKPTLKTDFDENPFKQSKRTYPVEFPYPFKDQFILNLTIPDTYQIEELPKSMSLKLHDNGSLFQYVSTVNGNLIQLSIKIQVSLLRYEPEEYMQVKDFFNQIATKSAEQVVLKKKNH